jgi:guanine nucleotide exchange factor VAV
VDTEVEQWTETPIEKRDYCVKELVETEKNYIDALNMIVKHFVRPLKSVMPQKERHIIFLHIKELAEIHRTFHGELFKSCSSAASPSRLSSCFICWKQKFVIYGSYCANLPRAQSQLDDLCRTSDTIRDAVLRCQTAANDGKFKLRDLLSLPMQRILKYHLLLNELMKCTSDSHEDFAVLKKAHEAMLDLGQYINEIKRDSETLQIIANIQKSIIDLDMPDNTELKDYGRLQKDGEVRMRSFEGNKQKTRYIFIFDKVMLLCKPVRGEQYSYREALILADYRVIECTNQTTSGFLHKDRSDHGWLLTHRSDPKNMYAFSVKTEEMKKCWLDALQKAHDNVRPHNPTSHLFSLHTFANPSSCDHCQNLLHGLFFQGYRCSVCKISVHKSCISKEKVCGAPLVPPARPANLNSISPSVPSFRSSNLSDDSTCRLNESHDNDSFCLPPSPSETAALEKHVWFVGPMSRESAQAVLEHQPHGSFLVRISPKQRGSFAISINFNGLVKHIRVCRNSDDQYFLSQTKCFQNIVDLVDWYEENSLSDSFHGLHVSLSHPCRSHPRTRTPSSRTSVGRESVADDDDPQPVVPAAFSPIPVSESCEQKV